MGAWPSNLCPYFQEETWTKLHVLKFEHPDIMDAFEK